jgi:hypothetical protein
VWNNLPDQGCQHGLASAELFHSSAQNCSPDNVSPDQLSQGDSVLPDAARDPFSCLVSADGGGNADPEPLPEPAGSGIFLLFAITACSQVGQASNSGVRLPIQPSATPSSRLTWRLWALAFSTGRCPRPLVVHRSVVAGVYQQDIERLDLAHGWRRLGLHCPDEALFRRLGRCNQPRLLRHRREPRAAGAQKASQ